FDQSMITCTARLPAVPPAAGAMTCLWSPTSALIVVVAMSCLLRGWTSFCGAAAPLCFLSRGLLSRGFLSRGLLSRGLLRGRGRALRRIARELAHRRPHQRFGAARALLPEHRGSRPRRAQRRIAAAVEPRARRFVEPHAQVGRRRAHVLEDLGIE